MEATPTHDPPERDQLQNIKFVSQDCDGFVAATKAEVSDYFASRGMSQKGDITIAARTIVMIGALAGSYVVLLTVTLPTIAMLGLCVVMGIALAGIGFGVSHDALHDAYSESGLLNRIAGLSFDALGASSYMWKITHNVIHHTYTNIHGVDEDLEVSPLLRLSPQAQRRPWQRFQHLYAPLAYSLSTLNWIFVKDFDYFSRRTLGPYRDPSHPRRAIVMLALSKAFAVTWMLVIPLIVMPLPAWEIILGFLIVHLIGGFILGVVFQLAHVVEQTAHPVPDAQGQMANCWLVHEMITTANFCVGNRLLTWYVGGLNYQIEHHLFPRVSSAHYPAISETVQRLASKYGIPYHNNPTLVRAVSSHLRTLKALGAH